jgi:hypothetical protein
MVQQWHHQTSDKKNRTEALDLSSELKERRGEERILLYALMAQSTNL